MELSPHHIFSAVTEFKPVQQTQFNVLRPAPSPGVCRSPIFVFKYKLTFLVHSQYVDLQIPDDIQTKDMLYNLVFK